MTGSALLLGWALGLDGLMALSLTTKSVTAPIALSVADKIGGSAPLTILSVFTTGILGVIITPSILRWIGVKDPMVTGLTLGLTSHAFGIARSVELGSEAVAFATLGMALMGCISIAESLDAHPMHTDATFSSRQLERFMLHFKVIDNDHGGGVHLHADKLDTR